MIEQIEQRLQALESAGICELLGKGLMGLEKESLRVSASGGIAMTGHPRVLGSALTHPWITTDYSEALTEFITPPMRSVGQALDYLADLQAYVYQHLDGELLWATSMPCVVEDESRIPIARYGTSNAGRMKHVYRVGLGNRYGRVMQVIAGVHFNYSVAESFWPAWQAAQGDTGPLRAFRDSRYMGLVRNLQRMGWLVPYLFGASPAVCKSFFLGKRVHMPAFDESTYYQPFATSLRMGDIGYQNKREEGLGIKACYDDVACYADSLRYATETPTLSWEALGVKVDGEYRQLNSNVLQIENEYYSSVRPKQPLRGLEKPSTALRERGVAYVELRSLDVNAYHPLGIDEYQLRFLEALILLCLLLDSPPISAEERLEIDRNLEQVAHQGRSPHFDLLRAGAKVSVGDWGCEILAALQPLCELLDRLHHTGMYGDSLDEQAIKIESPDATPSARMLAEMRENGEGFYHMARRLSLQHQQFFRDRPLADATRSELDRLASESLQQQAVLEQADTLSFDEFLADYFASP